MTITTHGSYIRIQSLKSPNSSHALQDTLHTQSKNARCPQTTCLAYKLM